jgi:hypothetical protein
MIIEYSCRLMLYLLLVQVISFHYHSLYTVGTFPSYIYEVSNQTDN